jgi:NAD(P)-dependent dehydrogenase (short-subunit alcohol dehydrogenase family)
MGQSLIERLAGDNCTVTIVDINEKGGKRLAAGIHHRNHQAGFMRVDAIQEDTGQQTFKKSSRTTGVSRIRAVGKY